MLVLFVLQLYPQGYKEEKNCSEKFCWMILESPDFQKYAGKIYEVSLKASLKKSISCFVTPAVSKRWNC